MARTSMVHPAVGLAAVVTMALSWSVASPAPASAACHIAGFVESEVEVAESDGVVSLVVELQGGQPSCAGTVDVTTVDGTAVAGEDYEAVERTLEFEANDDRVETVDITILADDVADDGETFTVELSDPTGDISGTGGPATVTIVEDDGAADDGTTDDATDDDTAADEDDADEDEDTAEDAAPEPAGEDDDGLDVGILLAVVAALAIAVGAFVVLRRRR